ncbi:DUF4357 domain-containing protein [Halobacillus litoralis]|uniref:DUF4357 domain-containing protein n=1 Tax=Halobacillus litoralis TaxID=45668 RepID=UPI001CD356CC|nr:DUF4357 domain-containing protein [Halobacillus litoralis]MCA0970653.1 DUF4357 domain-containing protein [Halobacillus litoralis]
MNSNLVAEETALNKIFSDDYIFTMPTVQRPYSWSTDEVGELLDDLVDFINHYEITEKSFQKISEPYFLGSIVLVKGEGPEAQVLDGQQRLTTLTILLAVLRDYLSDEEIQSMILQKGKKLFGTKDTHRLQLRPKDNDFFKEYIQEKGSTTKLSADTSVSTDSQNHIAENTLYLYERLNELDEEVVQILPSVIANLCYLVVVSTGSFDSAFRIFTVLNDRGLDLMTSDILKAKVVGEIPDEKQEKYTAKWEEVEVTLGRSRFNKLFDHIRMIIQKRKGSANIKDEYEEIFQEISGARFIDDILIPYSEAYMKIVDFRSHFNGDPEIVKVLSLLDRIDNSDWIPIAIYYMNHYNTNLKEFLKELEVLAGTSMVLRKNFNWRMSRYAQILRTMSSDKEAFVPGSSLLVKKDDKKKLLDLLQGDVYTELKDSARRYVLLRLDSLLTEGQPYYDHKVITVEHILPQTPKEDSHWIEKFGEIEEYVHKLGNLVLLTRRKNAQARNYEFDKKKKSYFQSKNGVTSFAITSQVIQEDDWTPDTLLKRQGKLISLLQNAWKLDEDNLVDPEAEKVEFYTSGPRGASAIGTITKNGFLVKRGSRIANGVSNSFGDHQHRKREALINNGFIIVKEDELILEKDYIFDSPSLAASVVLGRRANGNTEWKSAEGLGLENYLTD